jgi:hypothetical protein
LKSRHFLSHIFLSGWLRGDHDDRSQSSFLQSAQALPSQYAIPALAPVTATISTFNTSSRSHPYRSPSISMNWRPRRRGLFWHTRCPYQERKWSLAQERGSESGKGGTIMGLKIEKAADIKLNTFWRELILSDDALTPDHSPIHEELRRRAYEIYLPQGATGGRDLENRLQAETDLRQANGDTA